MAVELKSARYDVDAVPNSKQAYDNTAFTNDTTGNGTSSTTTVDIPYEANGAPQNKHSFSFDDFEDSLEEDYNGCQRCVVSLTQWYANTWNNHNKTITTITKAILLIAYFGYFGYAMYYKFGDEGSWRLLGFTLLAVLLLVLSKISSMYDREIAEWWKGTKGFRNSSRCGTLMSIIKWFLRVGVLIFLVVYVVVDIAIDHPYNLVSVAGLALYILIFYVTSVNPAKVNWHTVFWGIALQYLFALMILRTQWGYDMFKWMGNRVTEFLEYTVVGIIFVFGEKYEDHYFAMKVLSIVIFFFTFINIMYYLGVMQAVIKVIGRFLAFCMGTTPAESINAAANIFVSMTESPLMIRQYLKDMTRSELHAVMTGGFATIAGGVLGAYISFGVPANHLLSASVMSAPAALAIAKLSYPETSKSKGSIKDFSRMEKSPEHNIFEAASNGASASIRIIGAIAVNVLAFLALLAFLNATLTWFGDRVGIENLTFELICSYVLYPVAFFMGTEVDDCRKVAELVGVKTFTNEFIAYGQLKELIQNRNALNNYTDYYNLNTTQEWYWQGDDIFLNITGETLKGGVISYKSEVIATYALCGFANFGSIGITLGGLGGLAPTRKPELAQMVLRAMICGNAACFLTACIAGLLFKTY